MQQAIVATGWKFGTIIVKFALQLTVVMILARILPVEAFGLIAQAMILVGLAAFVADFGMTPALVQRPNLNELHIRTGFTLSVLAGAVMTAVVWLSAPLAA